MRKFRMILKIKAEKNPPKIGNAEKEGEIAYKDFTVPDGTDFTSPIVMMGLIEMEEQFMKEFCEVKTIEIN